MSVLFQFKEANINRKATVINVRKFFNDDVPKLEEVAGRSLNAMLSSPKLDNIGGHGTHLNSVETLMINSVDAKNELRVIAQVIDECNPENRKMLILRHLQDLSPLQIRVRLYISSSTYYDHLHAAYLEFANRYYYTSGRDLRILDQKKTTN